MFFEYITDEKEINSKAEEIFSKSNTLRSVRFDDITLEHSISVQSVTSWQDSSFEDSFRDKLSNYDGYLGNDADKTTKNILQKENSNDSVFGKLSSFKSSTENLINSPKGEKRCVKAILGVISGIILGLLLFLVYKYSFGYSFEEAGILTAFLTVLICIGLALSSFIRCIIALVVPNFFSGVGRAVLLSAIFGLILNHPIANISYNARETGSSMACVVEMAVNQTRELQREMAIPLADLTNYVKKQKEEMQAVSNQLDSKFDTVKKILAQLGDEAATADEALESVRKV